MRFRNSKRKLDGVDIYFLHIRSRHERRTSLVLTHGWPGSIIEFLKVIPALRIQRRMADRRTRFSRGYSGAARLRIFGPTEAERLERGKDRARLEHS